MRRPNPTRFLSHVIGPLLLLTSTLAGPELAEKPEITINPEGISYPYMNLGVASSSSKLANFDYDIGGLEFKEILLDDFNNDGIEDLVSVVQDQRHTSLVFQSGRDEFLWGNYEDAGDPFKQEARSSQLAGFFDFVKTGDFNGDSEIDILLASKNSQYLSWIAGNGEGDFGEVSTISFKGHLQDIVVDDLDRPDGLNDILFTTKLGNKNQIILVKNVGLGFQEPEIRAETDEDILALHSGRLKSSHLIDTIYSTSKGLFRIAGRDPFAPTSLSEPELILKPTSPIVGISSGDFKGNESDDLVLVQASGDVSLFDVDAGQHHTSPYFVDLENGKPQIISGSFSTHLGHDIAVYTPGGNTLSIFHSFDFHDEQKSKNEEWEMTIPAPRQAAPRNIKLASKIKSLKLGRLNKDGLLDFVLGSDGENGAVPPIIMASRPVQIITVNEDSDAGPRDFQPTTCVTELGGCNFGVALDVADRVAGLDEIRFDIPRITTLESIRIDESLVLDGSSQGRVVFEHERSVVTIEENAVSTVIRSTVVPGLSIRANDCLIENNNIAVNDGADTINEDGDIVRINSQNNTFGGTAESFRNVTTTIWVHNSDNKILGNHIGVSRSGFAGLIGSTPFSSQNGIEVRSLNSQIGIFGMEIGNEDFGSGNVISGTESQGIANWTGIGAIVMRNLIGTDITGSQAIPNSRQGIFAQAQITVGGSLTELGNVVSGNTRSGIVAPEGSIISGNIIGLDKFGTDPIPNQERGISATNSTIGGEESQSGNVISANTDSGINCSGCSIQGNYIGTDKTGTLARGNGEHGISVSSGNKTEILSNVIAANTEYGILVSRDSLIIQGNFIGTDRGASIELGNGQSGIRSLSNDWLLIGGVGTGEGNTIAFNGGDGVTFNQISSVDFEISGNRIFDNDGLGIDDSILSNDPSEYTGYPELSLNPQGQVVAMLSGDPSENIRIEFFGSPACDPSGFGEGKFFLRFEDVTLDGSGNFEGVFDISASSGQNIITATRTSELYTSEFSTCAEVSPVLPIFVKVMQDPLGRVALPIDDRLFSYGKYVSDASPRYVYLGTGNTDSKGILELPRSEFGDGDAYFLRAFVDEVPSTRPNHGDVDNIAYEVIVDNLSIDQNGEQLLERIDLSKDTLVSHVDHTALAINLVVSIEWPVSDTYLSSIIGSLAIANKLLVDVTNGQAYLSKISIWDNGVNWKDADIQIVAQNNLRPHVNRTRNGEFGLSANTGSYLRMSPIWTGNTEASSRTHYEVEPLEVTNVDYAATIVHELAHYVFGLLDEYQDKDGNLLRDLTKFGIMDNQYGSRGWASEFSSDPGSSDYQKTEQYQSNSMKNSWVYFDDKFSRTYGSVVANMHTPQEQGLGFTEFIDGPNQLGSNGEIILNDFIDFTFSTASVNDDRTSFFVKDSQGRPFGGADIAIKFPTQAESVILGNTVNTGTNKGKIRPPFQVNIGDELIIAGDLSGVNGYEYLREVISTLNSQKSSNQGSSLDDVIFTLKKLDGAITLLPNISFGPAGTPSLEITSSAVFSNLPRLEVQAQGVNPAPVPMMNSSLNYSGTIDPRVVDTATLIFNAEDDSDNTFPATISLAMYDVDEDAVSFDSRNRDLEFFVENKSQDISRIAVADLNFPSPKLGLPDSVRQVSPSYSISSFPENAQLEGQLTINYQADSLLASTPEAVTIYQWSDRWVALDTRVVSDTLAESASAQIEAAGVYAAFLDLRLATQTDVENDLPDSGKGSLHLEQNYPNPFQTNTTLAIDLVQAANISVEVFDLLGRKVDTIFEGFKEAGEHQLNYNASRLIPGVYIYQLKVNGKSSSGSMTKTR